MQAMVDVSAEAGWLTTSLRTMQLAQMVVQGRWLSDSTLLNVPHMNDHLLAALWDEGVEALPQLMQLQQTKPQRYRKMSTLHQGVACV